MSNTSQTSRRSFLKSGALVAAPVAAVALPAAALAEDGSKAALARLQDERAIEALNRDFLRSFNQNGARGVSSLFAGRASPLLAGNIRRLSMDAAQAPKAIAIAQDGKSATASFACSAEMLEELAGEETIVQMARLQGNPAASSTSSKTLSARYVRGAEGWLIADLSLA